LAVGGVARSEEALEEAEAVGDLDVAVDAELAVLVEAAGVVARREGDQVVVGRVRVGRAPAAPW
jgi:hypothetical protein